MLPAYNEEESLLRLLPKIDEVFCAKNQSYRIVVINDGSNDKTEEILLKLSSKYPLSIITHEINRGLGETERDGFEYIAANSDSEDFCIRMDCDDTHEPEYTFAMIDKLNEGYDVVSASRFQTGGGQKGVSGYRSFISYSANLFMKLMFNIPGIKDYSCGYRAYRCDILKYAIKIYGNSFIQLKGLGFTSTLETIVKLKMLGCKFSEVPFILRYDQKASASKMIGSITTLGYFCMAFLYHWPFGGWRSSYKNLAKTFRESPNKAIESFSYTVMKRSGICKIGG